MSVVASCAVEPVPARRTSNRELERMVRASVAGAHSVELVERRPMICHSTFPLTQLRLRHADGGEEWLVWKDLSRHDAVDPAWAVKPAFVQDPRREIDAYREVLDPAGVSAPAFRGAATDASAGRFWLFLELVAGRPLWQHGEPEVWRAAARWLAELHGRFAERTPSGCRRLLAHDARYFGRWTARLRRLKGRRAPTARQLDQLIGACRAATRWLAAQPVTLVHGELYPSNILVEDAADAPRIRPVDWEMAGIGPGLLDLAALTSGSWTDEERGAIAETYRIALPERRRPSVADLRDGLDRCRLLLAIQWLTWCPGWSPPAEHEHDWLGTAIELAQRHPGSEHGARSDSTRTPSKSRRTEASHER